MKGRQSCWWPCLLCRSCGSISIKRTLFQKHIKVSCSTLKRIPAFKLLKPHFCKNSHFFPFPFVCTPPLSASTNRLAFSPSSREPCVSGATPWRPWWAPTVTGAQGWGAGSQPAWAEEDCRRAPANAQRAPSLWVTWCNGAERGRETVTVTQNERRTWMSSKPPSSAVSL